MINSETLENYEKYLGNLQNNIIDKFFEEQKAYIKCKMGCSSCCEKGEYPCSELELMYLMKGFNELDEDTKNKIQKNVNAITKELEESLEKLYICPFLIDNCCSVYENRMLICRTHGLLFYKTNKEGQTTNKIPACVEEGLNYSEVYDKETKTISEEKWLNSGIETKPIAHNIDREILINNSDTKKLNLDFSESKKLIDWLK